MATNFTNKYMQVFQNYNEFGEHSADYVRGEDHIAFLIEENEVIYWLYLEQVWRPLNVRTTTTGQLEDGRTKVAVRLEYVEGGQKYTSVPNIPDPERITSMSHFLEDYPDIEEVNVSGTVNLTDLSYAFAGSKIKDFSMLDTSNVIKIEGFVNNVEWIGGIIKINIKTITDNDYIINLHVNTFNVYASEETDNYLILSNCTLVDTKTNIPLRIDSGSYNNIETENNILIRDAGQSARNSINLVSLTTTKNIEFNINNIVNDEQPITVYCDNFTLKRTDNTINDKKYIVVKANSININNNYHNAFNFNFGYGIDYRNNNNIILNGIIGNFIFTTPIVDDAFYAKYAQYNIPISIFQYKTTFTEVADVNINSKVNSNLLYVNWSSINFDTSNMNIEINNNIDLFNNINTFKKFIWDNTNIVDDNIPKLYNCNIEAEDGYISGKYKSGSSWNDYGNGDSSNKITIRENSLYKNIILYDYSNITLRKNDILTTNNIKIGLKDSTLYAKIIANENDNTEIDLYNLKDDNNVINCSLKYYPDNILKYDENITLNLNDVNIYVKGILNYINKENENNFTGTIEFDRYDTFGVEEQYNKLAENIYLNSNETISLDNFINELDKNTAFIRNYVTNIYGNNIEVIIPTRPSSYMDLANIVIKEDCLNHIDIAKTRKADVFIIGYYVTIFKNLDEESTINLITKLIDNTSESTVTIYMYRSQANIIGEENIAAAVAKNYEFAIIEN